MGPDSPLVRRGKRIASLMIREVRKNPGAPFIVAFIYLLLLASIYLALGNEGAANLLAEYAYYSLVIGVLLELVSVIRSRPSEEEADEEETTQQNCQEG